MKTGTKILIGASVITLVGLVTFYIVKNKKSNLIDNKSSELVDLEIERKKLDIQTDNEKRIRDCKKNCDKKLLIPVLGVGLAVKCKQDCK